jgi:AcrR family transcriptional regulator
MAATRVRTKSSAPQARGDAFVQVVLEVSLARLAEVGFERFSIPEVAALAGANKTSVYRRWPTKTELVRDALKAGMGHADQPPDTGALRGDLLGLAQSVATFMEGAQGTAILRILLTQPSHPQLRQLAMEAYGEIGRHGPWVVLSRAVQRGELRPNVDHSLVLFTVAGALLHRVFVEQGSATPAFLEQVVDLVLKGAQVEPQSSAP